jgi:nitronate monooxygenase
MIKVVIKTRITEMYGIEKPIIMGGLMYLGVPKLAAAVSNAGGLGCITAATWENPEDFREAVRETKRLTNKPFNVNVTMLPSFRFTFEHFREYLTICAEEKVGGVEISGSPIDKAGPEFIPMLRDAGVKMMHKVGAVRHARHAVKVGYDAIMAAGIEEGGHPLDDDVSTMVLTNKMCKTFPDVPVITVGGIADGIGLAAALALGADAVMMASRIVATQECHVHVNIKNEIVNREEMDTVLHSKSIGLQGRALRNDLVAQILEKEEKGATLEELAPLITGERMKKAWVTGDINDTTIGVGQTVGLINDIPTCKELLDRMIKEAEEQINCIAGKCEFK